MQQNLTYDVLHAVLLVLLAALAYVVVLQRKLLTHRHIERDTPVRGDTQTQAKQLIFTTPRDIYACQNMKPTPRKPSRSPLAASTSPDPKRAKPSDSMMDVTQVEATTQMGTAPLLANRDDVPKDMFCDPDSPKVVQFADISAAAFKIRAGVLHTPCTRSNQLTRMLDIDLFFKKEFEQVTGSFKERGARYALMMLNEEQKKAGVIAASAGNHALALCYHGQQLNIPVTVVMPVIAPIMKVSLCRTFGANVIVYGAGIAEAKTYAMRMTKQSGQMYINGYDHPHVLAGQGTLGLEMMEQVDNVDYVVIPVGGGGLIAGMAVAIKYLKPSIKIIAVESVKSNCFQAAYDAKKPQTITSKSTLADGLAVNTIGVNSFASCVNLVDKVVQVSESYIALAILRLIEVEKAVVEGAGAAALAALLTPDLLPELKGKRVIVPLTGGNIDTTVLGRCIERGLAVDGRLARFEAVVSDRPGGIAELTGLLASNGASIKDIFHERAWLTSDVFSVNAKCVIELRDRAHSEEMEAALRAHYTQVVYNGR